VRSVQLPIERDGSDVSFEELERTPWERWQLATRGSETEGGRDCCVVEAVPQIESQFGRLLVWIDRERVGVARIDFYRPGALDPFKRLRIALADAAELSERPGGARESTR